MIRIQADLTHRRVLLREGSRILGEIIYQLESEDGWLSPVSIEHDGEYVTVVLSERAQSREQPFIIIDRFVPSDGSVEVHRTWRFPPSGAYRLLVDYRAHGERGHIGVLPGVAVCNYENRLPSPEFGSPYHLLSLPGAVVSSESDASGLLLMDGDTHTLSPSIHLYESEHRHAIQVRCPGIDRVLRGKLASLGEPGRAGAGRNRLSHARTGYDGTARLSFLLILNEVHPAKALLEVERRAWIGGPVGGEPGPTDAHSVSSDSYRALKLAHVNRHIARDRRGVYGLRPARDERRRQAPPVRSALAPYWSLVAARALAQVGRQNAAQAYSQEAEEMCRYFLSAKRPKGLLCDVYDLRQRAWGTMRDGAFHAGSASLTATASIGRLLLETYADLRSAGRDTIEFARAAGDIASYLLDTQDGDGLWPDGDSRVFSSSEVLSLLIRLEAARGGNSLRRSAIRSASGPFVALLGKSSTLELLAHRPFDLVAALRASNDLGRYFRDESVVSRCKDLGALLLSWVFTRNVHFDERSVAARYSLRTRGLLSSGEYRPQLDFEGLPAAYEFARLHGLSGDELFATAARCIVAAQRQMVGGDVKLRRLEEGAQPAEIDYAGWSSRRRDRNSNGAVLGTRIGQSAWALYAATLLEENYPEIWNVRSSSS